MLMEKKDLLLEVDEVKITIIMDNIIDVFMSGNEIVHRFNIQPPLSKADGFSALVAVHGF